MPSDDQLKKNSTLRNHYNSFVRNLVNTKAKVHSLRYELACKYLTGRGIEIGAFHRPNALPAHLEIDYTDHLSIDEQKKVMPDFMDYYCVFPSFVTDGCILECITDCEYDFLIANHMIEHARNCFDAILNHLRVIKTGGHLLYAVPDKNHTFDKPREMTTYEHLRDELPNGVNENQLAHYLEYNRVVNQMKEPELSRASKRDLETNTDIHWHVWDLNAFVEHLELANKDKLLNVEIVHAEENCNWEFNVVLRKK